MKEIFNVSPKLMNALQLMCVVAVLLTLLTGHTVMFNTSLIMLAGLKMWNYCITNRAIEGIFAIVYCIVVVVINTGG